MIRQQSQVPNGTAIETGGSRYWRTLSKCVTVRFSKRIESAVRDDNVIEEFDADDGSRLLKSRRNCNVLIAGF